MFKLDPKTLTEFTKNGVKKIKIFFYSAGCSGTKVDIVVDDFEVSENLTLIPPTPSPLLKGEGLGEKHPFEIYVEKKDKEKFENATVTRLVKADHTGEAKPRYIYSDESVEDRCGCGTSFAFEKKKPKFDFTKLKFLKQDFKK